MAAHASTDCASPLGGAVVQWCSAVLQWLQPVGRVLRGVCLSFEQILSHFFLFAVQAGICFHNSPQLSLLSAIGLHPMTLFDVDRLAGWPALWTIWTFGFCLISVWVWVSVSVSVLLAPFTHHPMGHVLFDISFFHLPNATTFRHANQHEVTRWLIGLDGLTG